MTLIEPSQQVSILSSSSGKLLKPWGHEPPGRDQHRFRQFWSALNNFVAEKPVKTANDKKAADFADALIVNKAKAVVREADQSYARTYSFDRAALQIDGTESP